MRIVTIFDSKTRPDTVGIYVDKALRSLGHDVTHAEPFSSEGIPKGHDLYLMVDDGIPYEITEKPDNTPLVYWGIDTHVSMGNQILKGKSADYVFAAQKNGIEELSKELGKRVYWLPLACDPDVHSAARRPKIYDVCFVGNVRPGLMDKRIDYLDVLFRVFHNFFYGQMPYNAIASKYAESKIVFNCSIKEDINMRCFEAACSGSLLLTDKIMDNGFEHLFVPGRNCVTYSDIKDMITKAEYYILNDDERERIALAGWSHVVDNHTYVHRAREIINILNGGEPKWEL